jgi:hypothetical protein
VLCVTNAGKTLTHSPNIDYIHIPPLVFSSAPSSVGSSPFLLFAFLLRSRLSNTMSSTSTFTLNHLPAFIAILVFIIVVIVASYVVHLWRKSVNHRLLKTIESGYHSFQQSQENCNSPKQPSILPALPIGNSIPGCPHVLILFQLFSLITKIKIFQRPL